MKTIIGLLGEVNDEYKAGLKRAYTAAVEKAGGLPVLLPYTNDTATMDEWIALCDGFIFTGGADVECIHYGQTKQTDIGRIQKYRDEFELKMFEKIYATEKPIMGICRGMQLINVALGGTLYQDIPSMVDTEIIHDGKREKVLPMHEVAIVDDTPLSALIEKTRMQANSFHHQAVDRLADALLPMAYADDKLLEAYYAPKKAYLRAFQWHPERLSETDEDNARIFTDFIRACKK